jgi:hypothetical protein
MLVGMISKIRFVPVVAIPPAYRTEPVKQINIKDEQEAYLFSQESHRESFIKQPQFSLLALLIIRITKDAPIEQRPVDVSNHGPDVTRTIRTLWGSRILDGLEVCRHRRVEIHRIAFVKGVDLAARGNLNLGTFKGQYTVPPRMKQASYVGMSKDEFAQSCVECVSIHTRASR